jgi:ER membrane protein complex subunit 7
VETTAWSRIKSEIHVFHDAYNNVPQDCPCVWRVMPMVSSMLGSENRFRLDSLTIVLTLPKLCHVPFCLNGHAHSISQQVTTTLEGRLEFPDKTPFNITTKITLNSGEYTTYSRKDGSFYIYDVPPGIHQLDIDSKTYHFGQIKIQLLEDAMDSPKCLEYAFPGAPKKVIKYPLVIFAKGTYQYFEQKKGFSIFSMLKNPMVLMMVFSVGMMVVMPKLMEGLDPEEKARMKQQMENQKDPTQMFSQMFGELTGSAAADDAPASGTTRRERREQLQQKRVKNQ